MKRPNLKDRIINDPTRVLTLANLISLLRAFSAIPIIYSMAYPEWNWLTGILILLAILSDALDGYFARRAGSVTHFGKWIDPTADFIVIISILVYLVGVGKFPGWFFYFYLIRHMTIAAFAIYCMNYGYLILHANWWGKWANDSNSLFYISYGCRISIYIIHKTFIFFCRRIKRWMVILYLQVV